MKIKILYSLVLLTTVIYSCATRNKPAEISGNAGVDTLVHAVGATGTMNHRLKLEMEFAYIKYVDEICNNSDYTNAMNVHEIDEHQFNRICNAFSSQSLPGKKETYGHIKTFMDELCRENYITFTFGPFKIANDDIRVTKSPMYYVYGSCYSMPLFKGLESRYHLQDTSIFTFYKAKELIGNDSNICITFSVYGNGSLHYYNISQDPTLTYTK